MSENQAGGHGIVSVGAGGNRIAPRHDNNVVDTLRERAQTHGDYGDKAAFIQTMKISFRDAPNWRGNLDGELTAAQCESLDMIATKIGRILYGDPAEADHWHDIAGYAKLGGGWKP